MVIRILAVLAILIFINPAQSQVARTEVWHWAVKEDSGELFAYSQNGDINLLLSNVAGWIDEFWRFSDSEAVGLINVSGQLSLYLLDEQSAEPVSLAFDPEQFELFLDEGIGLRLGSYSDSFMVLTTLNPLKATSSRPLMLLDLSLKQLELLSDSTYPRFRITADGTRLRYIHRNLDGDLRTLELRERSLAEGTERILYELSGESRAVDSDINGERWLFEEQDRSVDLLQYHIFYAASGTDKVIYTRDPAQYHKTYGFLGDDIISYQPVCEMNCTVELQMSSGVTLSYELPDTPGGSSKAYLYKTEDRHLVIGRLYDYWLLNADKPPTFIGYRYVGGSGLPPTTSPDNRFALIADVESYPPSQRMVVDMETQQMIVALPDELENPVYMTYVKEGFIVNTLNKGNRIMYRYSTQELTDLPDIGYGSYFDILPDGRVLYGVVAGYRDEQVYFCSPQNSETRLLIEDVLDISIVDARLGPFFRF